MESHEAENVVYQIGMAVNTLVTAMGMLSDNLQRLQGGYSIAYDAEAFNKLIEDNGMYHNSLVGSVRR